MHAEGRMQAAYNIRYGMALAYCSPLQRFRVSVSTCHPSVGSCLPAPCGRPPAVHMPSAAAPGAGHSGAPSPSCSHVADALVHAAPPITAIRTPAVHGPQDMSKPAAGEADAAKAQEQISFLWVPWGAVGVGVLWVPA